MRRLSESRKTTTRRLLPRQQLPAWITADVIADTRIVWQPFYAEDLTDEVIVDLLLNVGTLFRVLQKEEP